MSLRSSPGGETTRRPLEVVVPRKRALSLSRCVCVSANEMFRGDDDASKPAFFFSFFKTLNINSKKGINLDEEALLEALTTLRKEEARRRDESNNNNKRRRRER